MSRGRKREGELDEAREEKPVNKHQCSCLRKTAAQAADAHIMEQMFCILADRCLFVTVPTLTKLPIVRDAQRKALRA